MASEVESWLKLTNCTVLEEESPVSEVRFIANAFLCVCQANGLVGILMFDRCFTSTSSRYVSLLLAYWQSDTAPNWSVRLMVPSRTSKADPSHCLVLSFPVVTVWRLWIWKGRVSWVISSLLYYSEACFMRTWIIRVSGRYVILLALQPPKNWSRELIAFLILFCLTHSLSQSALNCCLPAMDQLVARLLGSLSVWWLVTSCGFVFSIQHSAFSSYHSVRFREKRKRKNLSLQSSSVLLLFQSVEGRKTKKIEGKLPSWDVRL